jgi:hypothetical protein
MAANGIANAKSDLTSNMLNESFTFFILEEEVCYKMLMSNNGFMNIRYDYDLRASEQL